MTTNVERLLTLFAGIVIGVLVMTVLPSPSIDSGNGIDAERKEGAVPGPALQQSQAARSTRSIPATQVEASAPRFEDKGDSKTDVSPISIPNVYEEHIAERFSRPRVSFADIHKIFKNEARDEPWAVAMESGINHYLANSGTGEWAVVEYVECRSKICEIAGYTTDGDQKDSHELIGDFLASGLWAGDPITHSSSFGPTDQKRFITIISAYKYSEYPSILSSL